ncbi:MAG: ABC transporter ATP-binding protein [Patescibacteria group bacterium]
MLKLFRFLKPYRVQIALVLLLVFVQSMADLYLPTLMSEIVNTGIVRGDTGFILRTGGWMLLVTAFGAICSIIASLFSARAAMGLGTIVREKVFTRVTGFSLHEFDKLGTPSLITRTTNDITQIQMVTMIILRMMLAAPMMAVGGTIMALSKDRPLTLILLVALPVLFLAICSLARVAMPLFRAMQDKIDRINLVLREKLIGIRVIRAFNRTEREKARFEEANEDLTRNYIRVNKIMAFMMPVIMLIMNLTSLSILWFGIIRIDRNAMNMGNLVAFTQYAMQIMFSMLMVSIMFIMVPRAQAAAARINEVLSTPPGIRDAATPKDAAGQKGYIEFRNVAFRYHGAEEPAVQGISFAARPGEITAIIGGTGAGKSTLVNLIARFYDVDQGSILMDGVDIREMTQESLRARIGLVPQKAILFSGSIAKNIRFGKEDATDEEVRHAAEVAQAMEFISAMDGGFDHEITQGGTNVSGGQKQRIAIARALVRKPEIYIFDDSFSALDFKTDARLRAALKKEIAEATAIIVAQRVGTVMDADRIIVLNEGRIAGMGTHRELMETCELYREIVASQLSESDLHAHELTQPA